MLPMQRVYEGRQRAIEPEIELHSTLQRTQPMNKRSPNIGPAPCLSKPRRLLSIGADSVRVDFVWEEEPNAD
jgi:hypothetical protein